MSLLGSLPSFHELSRQIHAPIQQLIFQDPEAARHAPILAWKMNWKKASGFEIQLLAYMIHKYHHATLFPHPIKSLQQVKCFQPAYKANCGMFGLNQHRFTPLNWFIMPS